MNKSGSVRSVLTDPGQGGHFYKIGDEVFTSNGISSISRIEPVADDSLDNYIICYQIWVGIGIEKLWKIVGAANGEVEFFV